MATTNANEPKLTVQFSGTGVAKDLTRVSLCDGQIPFLPLPLGNLVTSPHWRMAGTTYPAVWSKDPARAVTCHATLDSGGTKLELIIKVVLHLEAGEQSLQFDTAEELYHEAGFYSQHLSEFQGDIVPRHYGVFRGETEWGGTIACAVLEYFSGSSWPEIVRGPWNTLESQYVGVPTA